MDTTRAIELDDLGTRLRKPLPEIPSKYFYDDRGSALFEQITSLPEYYPTRTELGILSANAGEVIDRVQPRVLAELGSGVGEKIRLLLDAMRARDLMERCILFDINDQVVGASVSELERLYPGLDAIGIHGDFESDIDRLGPGGARLILFLAGTIGNLHPDQVSTFLARVAAQMAPDDGFLVGIDLVKDTACLEAAYNDSRGVTAAFNRNILSVLNARFGSDFDETAFAHRAFFDVPNSWVEMRLVAQRPTLVRIPELDLELAFSAGDEIRTELSCKYTRSSFDARLPGTGLRIDRWFTDPDQLFALALLRRVR